MNWALLLVIPLVHICVATPPTKRWDDVTEKHSWVDIPKGWEYISPAPANMVLEIRIGLKQDRLDDLITTLMETSDPSHGRYGKHLSKVEADALIAPHPEAIKAVESWLSFYGINLQNTLRANDWITLRTNVTQAEKMLGAKYDIYNHTASSQKIARTISYSLPRELHPYVDVVAPTTYFGTVRSMRSTSLPKPDLKSAKIPARATGFSTNSLLLLCRLINLPECLRKLYNTANYQPTQGDNKIGVAGYLDEYASYADLQKFLWLFRRNAYGSNFTTVKVNGGKDDQNNPGFEANLDIQYSMAMSFPIQNIYYSTGGSPPFNPDSGTPTNNNEPYLDWLNFILSQPSIPQVITTSYGENEQTVPKDYATKVCNMFAVLGARGTTVFFSSGDEGVGGSDCRTNDGKNKIVFQPSFPASCPYVTAVGGTRKVDPEVAASFSGGGFSRYFAQPIYQGTAVRQFFARSGGEFSGLYNASGRAYPDLSAQASGFAVVVNGHLELFNGTSASVPTVAGIFSLLNDYKLGRGEPSLGFINPLIYSNASSSFNDIVTGSNPGCNTTGFTAGKGWDPVTGLGTPDFAKLKRLIELSVVEEHRSGI